MSKRHKFKVGDFVTHDFSANWLGEIHEVRNDPNGYDYFVRFVDEDDDPVPVAKDWYKESVLVKA